MLTKAGSQMNWSFDSIPGVISMPFLVTKSPSHSISARSFFTFSGPRTKVAVESMKDRTLTFYLPTNLAEKYHQDNNFLPDFSHSKYSIFPEGRCALTLESEVTGLSKCATDILEETEQTGAVQLSKCATDVESAACLCREVDLHHTDETLEQARELCTLPDKHRPAMTLLLDVLESLERQSDGKCSCASAATSAPAATTAPAPASSASAEDDRLSCSPLPTMSIRFFIPRGLYGVWNEAARRYVSLVSPDDGIELLVNNEGVANFIAIMLSEYLLAEKAHHKATQNNKVLERDGYKCQVPGCSNRRNIHAHHIVFRSHGGSDAIKNKLSLCAAHHLWILHILHGLLIEGTAPDDLKFTFGPSSSPEGQPFMIYSGGRKVFSPEP